MSERRSRARRRVAVGLAAACVTAACSASPGVIPVVDVDLEVVSTASASPAWPAVRVVRVSSRAPLAELLRAQASAASATGDRLLVVTSRAGCPACVRFFQALDQGPLREALTDVVVLRVDASRYGPEFAALGLDSYVLPAFFLLDGEGRARDGITSAEWGDDVATNIAPVVGSFAHERYTNRRAPSPR